MFAFFKATHTPCLSWVSKHHSSLPLNSDNCTCSDCSLGIQCLVVPGPYTVFSSSYAMSVLHYTGPLTSLTLYLLNCYHIEGNFIATNYLWQILNNRDTSSHINLYTILSVFFRKVSLKNRETLSISFKDPDTYTVPIGFPGSNY